MRDGLFLFRGLLRDEGLEREPRLGAEGEEGRCEEGTGRHRQRHTAWINTAVDIGSTDTGSNGQGGDLAVGAWYLVSYVIDDAAKQFRLYLNGALEAQVATAVTPRFDSIQHASQGTAMNSSGAAAGFFAGLLDEDRVWNVARTEPEISTNQNVEIHAAPGLIGHWGLNEGTDDSPRVDGPSGLDVPPC